MMEWATGSISFAAVALQRLGWAAVVLWGGWAGGQSAAAARKLQVEEVRYKDGSLWYTRMYYLDKQGKKVWHGAQVQYRINRMPHSVSFYKDGKPHGLYTSWHFSPSTDAEKQLEGRYVDGKREGVWNQWRQNGDLHWRCTYKDGHEVGKKQIFNYPSFPAIEELYSDEGYLVEETHWHGPGVKMVHGTYKPPLAAEFSEEQLKELREKMKGMSLEELAELGRPRKHGVWTYSDPDGEIVAQGEWKDGKPWEGVCGVEKRKRPVKGFFGRLVFGRYKQGKLIEEPVPVRSFVVRTRKPTKPQPPPGEDDPPKPK